MATTYYYGKDKKGNPVYESSSSKGTVNASQAVAAPYSGGSSSSSLPNIVLSSQKYDAQGLPIGQTKTQNYSGSTPIGDATYKSVISSSALSPSSSINIPTPAPTSTTGTNAMTLMAGLAAPATPDGTQKDATTPTALPTDLQTRLNAIVKPPKTADIYSQALKETQVNEKQQLVNTYQNQLNAIVAKSTADKLAVTGQGRGIPEVIIGGQQAQIDKEAAIQSLPIAAQLSAAQGDLAMAKDHLNTLFSLRSQDAKNEYDFNQKLVDTVFNYADKQQQLQLDAIKTKRSEDFTTKINNLDYAQTLATAAISNGQPSTAAALMRLDPNDPNYSANIANLARGISVQKSSSSSSSEVSLSPTDKQILLGANFTSSDIAGIERDVSQYGLDKVLNQVSGSNARAQQSALRKVYGQAEASIFTRENIANLYGIADNNTKTDWWGLTGKTNAEKLTEYEIAIKKYQDAGYTDAQITALLKK